MFASTDGVLPVPICLLCGVEILLTDELGMPREYGVDPTLRNKKRWKDLWNLGKKEHLILSSDEVEDTDKFPRLWSCLYRASRPLKSGSILNSRGYSN